MARNWEPKEISYLKRYAKGRTVSELSKRFGAADDVVEAKLKELALSAKDSVGPARLANDPEVLLLEKGVKLLHSESWSEADKIFKQVAAKTDVASIAEQARRYSAACSERLAKGPREGSIDPFLQAVYERNRGNLDAALEICSRGGRRSKDERFAYLAAAILAVRGELDDSAKYLELAIELNPANRVHAHHDTDFDSLRSHPEHAALFQAP
jgi:tetratricopeptide (TPR) repeat protein